MPEIRPPRGGRIADAAAGSMVAAVRMLDRIVRRSNSSITADRALYQAKRFGRNRICAGSFVSKGPVVAKLRGQRPAYAAAGVPTFGRDDDLARILSAVLDFIGEYRI